MKYKVHPTAVIDTGAEIGEKVGFGTLPMFLLAPR